MATAGRILIIPRGEYSAEATYDMLDMVSYGGKGWVCKQTCTGIAPVEGDYWTVCIDVSEELNAINKNVATNTSDISALNESLAVQEYTMGNKKTFTIESAAATSVQDLMKQVVKLAVAEGLSNNKEIRFYVTWKAHDQYFMKCSSFVSGVYIAVEMQASAGSKYFGVYTPSTDTLTYMGRFALDSDLTNYLPIANPQFAGLLSSATLPEVNRQVINTTADNIMYIGNGNLAKMYLEVNGVGYDVEQLGTSAGYILINDGRTIDDLTSYGHYTIYINTDNPVAGYCNVIVLPYNTDSNYCQQIVTSLSSGRMYHRHSRGGTWNGWNTITISTDLDSKANASTAMADLGIVGDVDLLEWAFSQTHGGTFLINPTAVTNLPNSEAGFYFGMLFVYSSERGILLSDYKKNYYIQTQGGSFSNITWGKNMRATDFTISNGVLTINLD